MSARFVRGPGVEMAPMKDETVLFNPTNNKFCVLNQTAAMIWARLESPQTVPEIVSALRERFRQAEPAQVERDVQAALQELGNIECVINVQ
jgi:PqqD family protein of HPr-rel-A system